MGAALRAILVRRGIEIPTVDPTDQDALARAFASAPRWAGRASLDLAADEFAALRAAGIDWPIARTRDELARIELLGQADVDAIYRGGDERERQAILRALPILPTPERFVALAVDACRTHIVPVFEAIAAENPYPARFFPEPAFNQMIMKAVFLEIALGRVIDLPARVTPELRRMARDYAAERRAAGRVISNDVVCLAEGRIP